MVNEVKATGHPDYANKDVCWDFFITKVRNNLHAILFPGAWPHHFAGKNQRRENASNGSFFLSFVFEKPRVTITGVLENGGRGRPASAAASPPLASSSASGACSSRPSPTPPSLTGSDRPFAPPTPCIPCTCALDVFSLSVHCHPLSRCHTAR